MTDRDADGERDDPDGPDAVGGRSTGLVGATRRAVDAILAMEREGVDRRAGAVRGSSGPVSVEARYDVRLGPFGDGTGGGDADE